MLQDIRNLLIVWLGGVPQSTVDKLCEENATKLLKEKEMSLYEGQVQTLKEQNQRYMELALRNRDPERKQFKNLPRRQTASSHLKDLECRDRELYFEMRAKFNEESVPTQAI